MRIITLAVAVLGFAVTWPSNLAAQSAATIPSMKLEHTPDQAGDKRDLGGPPTITHTVQLFVEPVDRNTVWATVETKVFKGDGTRFFWGERDYLMWSAPLGCTIERLRLGADDRTVTKTFTKEHLKKKKAFVLTESDKFGRAWYVVGDMSGDEDYLVSKVIIETEPIVVDLADRREDSCSP